MHRNLNTQWNKHKNINNISKNCIMKKNNYNKLYNNLTIKMCNLNVNWP